MIISQQSGHRKYMKIGPISHNVLEKLTNSLASLTPRESIIALVEVPTESETFAGWKITPLHGQLSPDQGIFQLGFLGVYWYSYQQGTFTLLLGPNLGGHAGSPDRCSTSSRCTIHLIQDTLRILLVFTMTPCGWFCCQWSFLVPY